MKITTSLLFLALLSTGFGAEVVRVGALDLEFPPGFKSTGRPEGVPGEVQVHRWQAANGSSIEIYVYDHYIKQDRGPIVVANKDSIEVAGQRTKLIETKIFFGEPKRVLAVYLNFGDTIYLIVADQIAVKDFMTFLQAINVNEN